MLNLYDRTFVSEQYHHQVREAKKSYQACKLVQALFRSAYARLSNARTRLKHSQQPGMKHSLKHTCRAQH